MPATGLTEWEELAAWSWVMLPSWRKLHHLVSLEDPAATQRDWAGVGTTSCGRRTRLALPGLFTRMSARRCETCCKRAGYPEGTGSPKNDRALHALVEAELSGHEGSA